MIIIQLLKDTKYPANYQIIIDSSLGNYAVLRDFFSALGMSAYMLIGAAKCRTQQLRVSKSGPGAPDC